MNITLPCTAMRDTPLLTARGMLSVLFVFEHGVEVRKMGLLGSNVQNINYDQIAQIVIKRGPWCTLIIESRGGHSLTIKGVPQPTAEGARAMIQERMNRALDTPSEGRRPRPVVQRRRPSVRTGL